MIEPPRAFPPPTPCPTPAAINGAPCLMERKVPMRLSVDRGPHLLEVGVGDRAHVRRSARVGEQDLESPPLRRGGRHRLGDLAPRRSRRPRRTGPCLAARRPESAACARGGHRRPGVAPRCDRRWSPRRRPDQAGGGPEADAAAPAGDQGRRSPRCLPAPSRRLNLAPLVARAGALTAPWPDVLQSVRSGCSMPRAFADRHRPTRPARLAGLTRTTIGDDAMPRRHSISPTSSNWWPTPSRIASHSWRAPSAVPTPARRRGQPPRPSPPRPRHTARRPRRHPRPQPGRVGRDDDRLLQGADRADQPQLSLRGPRASLRRRQRRPDHAGLRARSGRAGRADSRAMASGHHDSSRSMVDPTGRMSTRSRPSPTSRRSSPDRPRVPSGRARPTIVYVLYTGGTTGMPKGVVWRQEDIFFAAMGGGGWGAPPIARPDELVGRINTDESRRMVMLVVGPLMHGNAQWAMWNTLMMAGTAVLYVDPLRAGHSAQSGRRRAGRVDRAGRRRHGPPPGRSARHRAARDLRHLLFGRGRLGWSHAFGRGQGGAEGRSCPVCSSWTASGRARAGPRAQSMRERRDRASS